MAQAPPEFGPYLKQCRVASGLSQSKLAEKAGYDHSYVSRLEAGARTPTLDAVIRLAEAMGLEAVEWDRLKAAAGFLPDNLIGFSLEDEPMIVTAITFFQHESLSLALKAMVEQVMLTLMEVDN